MAGLDVSINSSKTLRDANPGHNGYDFEVRRLLRQRFGAAQTDQLIKVYEDSWITETDLDRLQALGLNAVRLTFAYDTLLNDDGTWRADASSASIGWCSKQPAAAFIRSLISTAFFLPAQIKMDRLPATGAMRPSRRRRCRFGPGSPSISKAIRESLSTTC